MTSYSSYRDLLQILSIMIKPLDYPLLVKADQDPNLI